VVAHSKGVPLRSCAGASSVTDTDARDSGSTRRQHPRREEQGGLGALSKSRWESRLHCARSPERQSPSARGENGHECGDGLAAAIRAGILLHHPRLAQETRTRISAISVGGSSWWCWLQSCSSPCPRLRRGRPAPWPTP